MTTLFNPDDYPAATDPVRAWRQAEAEMARMAADSSGGFLERLVELVYQEMEEAQ